ncbi:MAG: serine hydrolase domain-containing protein [Pseudomonadota bacterium]
MRVFRFVAYFTLPLILSLVDFCPPQAQTPSVEAPLKLQFEDLADLETSLRNVVETKQLANLSFEVWQDNQLVRAGFYGPVSEQNPETVSDTTIHRIYSMTKPVTAVGLLILMERGAFRLDNPITKFLPEFEATEVLADADADGTFYTYLPPRPPTMAQLLSHTAGFAYGGGASGPVDQKLTEYRASEASDSDVLTELVSRVPYMSAPGAEWNYSIASDLQGAIVERITGEDLDTFFKREIFDPLGTVDSGFYVGPQDLDRVSGMTHRVGSGFDYVDAESPSEEAQVNVYFEGGHGLFSTQHDYARFLAMLVNEGEFDGVRILQPETVLQFHTNAIQYRGRPSTMSSGGSLAGLGFGFGVAVLENREVAQMSAPLGTYYWWGAKGTWFWVDPVNRITFVGMIQTESELDTDLILLSMRHIYGPLPSPDAVSASR